MRKIQRLIKIFNAHKDEAIQLIYLYLFRFSSVVYAAVIFAHALLAMTVDPESNGRIYYSLSSVAGSSWWTIIVFLWLQSYVLKFCEWHRIFTYYCAVNLIIFNLTDNTETEEIAFYVRYGASALAFLAAGTSYILFKRHGERKRS